MISKMTRWEHQLFRQIFLKVQWHSPRSTMQITHFQQLREMPVSQNSPQSCLTSRSVAVFQKCLKLSIVLVYHHHHKNQLSICQDKILSDVQSQKKSNKIRRRQKSLRILRRNVMITKLYKQARSRKPQLHKSDSALLIR